MRSKSLMLLFFAFVMTPGFASAQSKLKPLPASANLADTQKWLVENITKHASYKTKVNSASVSDVRFDGCSVGITLVKKTAVAMQDVVGVTTRTHSSKQDVAFHFSFVEPDGISVGDHIFPEFQVITIRFRAGDQTSASGDEGREHEIIVKRNAADPIRDALLHARRLCMK